MNKIIYNILVFSIVVIALSSCQDEPETETSQRDHFNDLLLSLTELDYAFYNEDRLYALEILSNSMYQELELEEMICEHQQCNISDIYSNLDYLEKNIPNATIDHLLAKLRTIKSQIISLETEDDYDPYVYMLWQYEEDMYHSTKSAMDPMLDLYEWYEFESMVACMNDSWERLQLHYPSSETLGNDRMLYRNQVSKKIHLHKSIQKFNQVVYVDDYPEITLCESAIELRTSFVSYLRAFLMVDNAEALYLAIL